MSEPQIADAMLLLAQRASVKDVALMLGVSEWEIAALFRPSRRRPKQ